MTTTAFLGVAHIHTPSFINRIKAREDVTCKAVYDHDRERAERRASELGAKFTDIESILSDPEITSVVVCSETNRHLELVERAAAAGKHMFVEKPLAATGEDAARIRSAIERAGVVFQTGFFMRSSPAMQFLKQEAAAGHLGTIPVCAIATATKVLWVGGSTRNGDGSRISRKRVGEDLRISARMPSTLSSGCCVPCVDR